MKLRLNVVRNIATASYDTLIAGVTFLASLYLRWGESMWFHAQHYVLPATLGVCVIMLVLVCYTRLYRRFWRYVSLKDITTIFKVCAATMLLFYGLFFLLNRLEMLPRSVAILHGLLLMSLMIGPRVMSRVWHEKQFRFPKVRQIPVMIIGATDEAETFIRESMRSADFPYRVVSVVATEAASVNRNIHHVKIHGQIGDIPAILRKLRRKGDAAQRIILATQSLDGATIGGLLRMADEEAISIARVPRLSDLTRGDRDPFDIRPIEVEDILGRAQVKIDCDAFRQLIEGQVVLVTGAGGSIGSELVRQVAEQNPRRLVLLELNEYALYDIDRELAEKHPDMARKAILANVRDQQRLEAIFAEHRPQLVFHAAALKHVPLCEHNVTEAVLTNVIGSQRVADACIKTRVPHMVQISTDKAVNPTNVMGACKRLAEGYCQALGQSQKDTRIRTVRFGNVLGSTGSVVPLFQRQLEKGGPLTVTHPEMTRYFMTTREAVRLVIQAACLPCNEDAAPIYVLEMGEAVRIDDLARQMIRLAGLRPGTDIAIEYTGLRAGEKLHEELFYDSEALLGTSHAAIQRAEARQLALKPLARQLAQLEQLALKHDTAQTLALLQQLVPEYQPDHYQQKKALA